MNRRRDWDDRVRPPATRLSGNPAQWGQAAAAKPTCQDEVDAKAFTGKGSLHELRHLVTQLAAVEARMAELSAASKALEGAYIHLVVHHRHDNAYTFLRWRERSGSSRHLPWGELAARLAGHAPAQRRWCAEASALAHQLNAQHLALRERIRALRLQLSQTPSPVYARPIPP